MHTQQKLAKSGFTVLTKKSLTLVKGGIKKDRQQPPPPPSKPKTLLPNFGNSNNKFVNSFFM